MAYPPSSRPGPSESDSQDFDPRRPENKGLPNNSLEHLATILGQHGAGPASTDLALDILLNDIVEQACLETGATGAAIALARDNQYICRASTGRNAPDLGMVLDSNSGLSGACIQSAELQYCANTEADPRVDAVACRALGVQSVLVVPLLKEGELLGVFEVLSPLPNAFKNDDIDTLLNYSRRIIETMSPPPVRAAPVIAGAPPGPKVIVETPVLPLPRLPESPIFLPAIAKPKERPRDFWTTALMVSVVGLSIFFGWLLGQIWKKSTNPSPSTVAAAKVQEPAAASAPATAVADPPATNAKENASSVAAKPKPAALNPSTAAGGLTVYENGKLVFQMTPRPERHPGVEYASDKSSEDVTGSPAQLSNAAALARLIQRVEPHYPDAARQQHIQGSVVLQTVVGKDGIVREMKALSGDSQLVMAAADAVRQWHFKPYTTNGLPVEFETQITVDFTLP